MSIITYGNGSKVWPIRDRFERLLNAADMDFWWWIAQKSRIKRIRIREVMDAPHTITDEIRMKQLK